MKKLIEDELLPVFRIQIEITRVLVLSKEALRKEWGLEKRTFYRYLSWKDREATRRYAKERTARLREIDTSLCHKCQKPIKTHKRCPSCTVLLHAKTCDTPYCIVTRKPYHSFIQAKQT